MMKRIDFRPNVASSAMRLAAETLEQQDHVPKSPISLVTSGAIELCLAAAVAEAGLILRSDPDSRSFRCSLAQSGDPEMIDRVFQELGWNADDSRRMREINDSIDQSKRKATVAQILREWAG
jgi:hypothetical protein